MALANLMVSPENSQKSSRPHKEALQTYSYQNFVSLGFLTPRRLAEERRHSHQHFAKRKKKQEAHAVDTAEVSTVSTVPISGTSTELRLRKEAAMWHSQTQIEKAHVFESWGLAEFKHCTRAMRASPGSHPLCPQLPADRELWCDILRNATQKQLRKLTMNTQWFFSKHQHNCALENHLKPSYSNSSLSSSKYSFLNSELVVGACKLP